MSGTGKTGLHRPTPPTAIGAAPVAPFEAKADATPHPTESTQGPAPGVDWRGLESKDGVQGVPAHALRTDLPLSDVAANVAWQFGAVLGPVETSTPSTLSARAQSLEDRAFEVLEALTPQRIGESEAAFDSWFSGVEARGQRGERLDMLEHLTLIHVLKSKLFDGHETLDAYRPRLEATLLASDQKLTGQPRSIETVLSQRLSRRVLRKESSDAQKIHAAVFAAGKESFCQALGDLIKDYVPNAKDPIIAVGLLATLFTQTGAELLGGAVHGYLLATLLEHAIHSKVGHASEQTTDKLEGLLSRFGPIGRAVHRFIDATRFSHAVVHHGSYSGNYVDRFAPADTRLSPEVADKKRSARKAMIDKQAQARGPAEAADIFKSDYGRRLAHALQNAMLTAPVTALVTLFSSALLAKAGLAVGPLFLAASVLTSLIFIPASNSVHQYLHMTRDEALAKAGPLMREFLKSRYVAHIAQHHYLHHKDARVNHNLVAGADFLLGYEPTRVDAIVALRKLESFY